MKKLEVYEESEEVGGFGLCAAGCTIGCTLGCMSTAGVGSAAAIVATGATTFGVTVVSPI